MKFKHIIWTLISSITLLTGCVGEDVVFSEEQNNRVSITRSLLSIAIDESFTLDIQLRDENNEVIDDLSEISIDFTSDNEEIIEVDQNGVLTPITSGSTTIRVNASMNGVNFDSSTDEIIVGRVTLSESEASNLTEDEISTIINEGFPPRITIVNPINTIGLENTENIQFNGVYQNFKNQIVDVTLNWESDNTNVLEINSEGTITPISEGTANITASFNSNGITTVSDLLFISVEVDEVEVVIEEVEVIPEEPINVDPETGIRNGVIGFGQLMSNSFYDVSGSFQIVRENGVTRINLDNEYATGNVPDLVIYLSNVTNTNNGAAFISEDITSSGEQSFIIPDSINPDDYINVLIYCRRFGARAGFGVINR